MILKFCLDPLGHHRVIVVVVVQVVARLVVVDQLHHRAHPRQAHHQAVIQIVVIQVAPRKNCSKGKVLIIKSIIISSREHLNFLRFPRNYKKFKAKATESFKTFSNHPNYP